MEETVREYGISRPVTVVENGNDMATVPLAELPEFRREARKRLGIEEGVPALLFVGQQIYEKGVGVILEALSLLQNRVFPS